MSDSNKTNDPSLPSDKSGLSKTGWGCLTLIAAPFIMVGGMFLKGCADNYILDKESVVLFTSIADCEKQGYSKDDCECSRIQADLAAFAGAGFSYSSAAEASRYHTDYVQTQAASSQPVVLSSNNVNVVTETTSDAKYEAVQTGWLAEKSDICTRSVPLFSGRTHNIFLRSDGAEYQRTANGPERLNR